LKLINLVIDGQQVSCSSHDTILSAAHKAGIRIPKLCFLRATNNIASCRVCVVEVEGASRLVTACNTPAQEGMVITTNSPRVLAARRTALSLILANGGKNALEAFDGQATEFARVCRDCGVDSSEFQVAPQAEEPVVEGNPFLAYNPNLCIQCQRCVGACNKRAGNHTLVAGKQGIRSTIVAPFGPDWKATNCESCGNCAQACPTGALTSLNKRSYNADEVSYVRTTCPHCATGCQYDLVVKDGRIVDTRAAKGPSNNGLLCVKGRFGSFDFAQSEDRLTTPLIKDRSTGEFREASWDEALDLVASKFAALRDEFGGEALAAFACARSANEDIYMLQKMARTVFRTNNVDNCARVCHAPSVAGLARTLGSGAMTNPIRDITNDVDVIMLVGSNPEEAHPVIGMQIRQAVEAGAQLIVVDPRDIGLTSKADIHLKLRPGTNVAFSNGMAHIMIEEGLIDEEFIAQRTEKFEEFREMVASYTPERVAEICGIDARDLIQAARLYASAEKAPIIYCLGVTEHSTGTEGVMSMSNMAMLCGKLGRPGCGVNPIRGQNNVQGACDMGALPTDFPGYQKLANEEVVKKFEDAWGVELPRWQGLCATEVFPAAIEGKIEGLFIFGEDPVRTDPDTHHVIRALESLDFLVMSELFLTETAKYADVILPGRAYVEKEGTFSNTERRVQRIRKAVEGPQGSRLDIDIFTDIMNRMGYAQPKVTSAQVMDEIASLTPSFAGISHARLDSDEVAGRGLQWPCLGPDHPGTPIMHVGTFSRGLGMFSVAEYRPSTEQPDESFPLIMMTGRVLSQYNACAMTSRTEGLNEMCGSSFIEVNTKDAAERGIADGDKVRVFSRRGEIISTARVSGKTNEGQTWMPFHFQDGNSNWLTIAALDNICAAPEYKVCAIQVEKA